MTNSKGSEGAETISPVEFRNAFRLHTGGVWIIGYKDASNATKGMTATSVSALTMDPPSVVFGINRENRTRQEIAEAKRFSLSILSQEQRHISERCSKPGADKILRDSEIIIDDSGLIGIRNALVALQCELALTMDYGGHTLFVGNLAKSIISPHQVPLVYYDGAYRELGAKSELIHGIFPDVRLAELHYSLDA